MAGIFPAIPVSCIRWIAAVVTLIAVVPDARAKEIGGPMRVALRGAHRTMMLAEQNLVLALKGRDGPRIALVEDALSIQGHRLRLEQAEAHPCHMAIGGLTQAAIAAAFEIYPVTSELGDRFSKAMRPDRDTLETWFASGSKDYRTAIAACEMDLGFSGVVHDLPETLPRVD